MTDDLQKWAEPEARCAICQAHSGIEEANRNALDRIGWDWFTGSLPGTAFFCPECQRERQSEIEVLRRKAGVGR